MCSRVFKRFLIPSCVLFPNILLLYKRGVNAMVPGSVEMTNDSSGPLGKFRQAQPGCDSWESPLGLCAHHQCVPREGHGAGEKNLSLPWRTAALPASWMKRAFNSCQSLKQTSPEGFLYLCKSVQLCIYGAVLFLWQFYLNVSEFKRKWVAWIGKQMHSFQRWLSN